MITKLASLFGGNILGGADKILGRFFADKDAVESNIHDEQMAAQDAMAAEYTNRGRRYWLDALIDFINRLPRPLFAFHVIALMYWAVIDPITFGAAMTSLSLMPIWLAAVVGQVILLFMGGRMLNNLKFEGVSPKRIKQVLEVQKEIMAMKPKISDEEFKKEMEDGNKALSNKAIDEWNRRRKAEG